jgi:hypothetical protein
LFICGGLPGRNGSLFQLDRAGLLSRGQVKGLAVLIVALLVIQLPLSLLGHLERDPDPAPQMAALQRIEEVEARCRTHRIAADTARQALGRLDLPYSGDPPRIDGWELLRGSAAPQPMTIDQARHLLEP